jgi:hypothetical protein
VDETVDKDMHRWITACERSSDSRQAGFRWPQGDDYSEDFGVIQQCTQPHNHSNNLTLRIKI